MVVDDFKIKKEYYGKSKAFNLVRRKGAVPYSFYTSHESYEETELRKDMFFNDLTNEFEPDEVFERSKEIWDYFKIKNHGEFIDLYLKTDVLLLTDCFEKFREANIKNFEIDPCYCFSTPSLAWAAGLNYTKIELELITDPDIHLAIEKCIRGGVYGVM
jgi:hypothetical protein